MDPWQDFNNNYLEEAPQELLTHTDDNNYFLDAALSGSVRQPAYPSQEVVVHPIPEKTKNRTVITKQPKCTNYTEIYLENPSNATMNPTHLSRYMKNASFKLPASRSPIMEALVVCALNGWGLKIAKNIKATPTQSAEVVFKVNDFNHYYNISCSICSKQSPTEDIRSRVKSLRRWFVSFPKSKERTVNPFYLMVKPAFVNRVGQIIQTCRSKRKIKIKV
jgi:hypothetical protein